MERPSEIIDRGDVTLRRWRGEHDVAAAFLLIEESLEHLRPWMSWVAGHSEAGTRALLATWESRWASGDAYNYAVVVDGTPVGMCQAHRLPGTGGWRAGYWLHPAATGRGIATRATAAVVTEMFALPDVEYVEVAHDLANTPSAAVPRRLGFTEVRRERPARPEAPACSGVEVVWRLDRPAPSPGTTGETPSD
ncbi:GNAT family N-acetyltransferase [Streptomyces sp. NPDC016309]|uniref:GNAT family N-acetyltransferase n=1 Tax=Streptomyces sp. NPDC016309 TaxID=3364965 RepID=UPI0036F6BE18